MATATGTFGGDYSGISIRLDTSEGTVDTANNTSVINWSVYLYYGSGFKAYDFSSTSYWGGSINGISFGTPLYNYDFRSATAGSTYALDSGTILYTHTSAGGGSVPLSIYSIAASPLGSSSTGTGSQDVTDISRPPQAPAAPTITRTGTGTTITVASAVAAGATGDPAPPAITNYKYRYSTNNSTWTEVTGMGTDRVQDFGPTSPITVSGTQVYYFQTAATNSEGYGPWSASKVAYAAPTITSLTRTGLSVAVAVSPNASNGGSTVTSHVVQASSDLTTWTSRTISGASGGSTTFSSLSPGKTWYFRAYATNAAGVNSPNTANQSVFISAYGKRYDATSAYVTINTGKRYDANGGGAGIPGWVDIQTAKKYVTNPITGASGSGSVVEYDSVAHPFAAGDVVSITGVAPSAYNLTNVTITGIGTDVFLVNSTATGTYSSGGTVAGWTTLR